MTFRYRGFLLLLFFGIFIPGLARGSQWQKYHDPAIGFDMDVDPTWKVHLFPRDPSSPMGGVGVAFIISLPGRQRGVIGVHRLPLLGTTLTEVLTLDLSPKDHRESKEFAGRPAIKVTEDKVLHTEDYYVDGTTEYWHIRLSASPSQWKQFEPIFQKAIRTFRFLK